MLNALFEGAGSHAPIFRQKGVPLVMVYDGERKVAQVEDEVTR